MKPYVATIDVGRGGHGETPRRAASWATVSLMLRRCSSDSEKVARSLPAASGELSSFPSPSLYGLGAAKAL